uniref:MFS transporter n=1 Tax=Cyberlindnera americana TaxID=36016 RepID=A0A5P8N8B7_9ASCO|nr:MFS transporter [Cyberlindnera americana]
MASLDLSSQPSVSSSNEVEEVSKVQPYNNDNESLESQLRREFTIEDALMISANEEQNDIETQSQPEPTILEKVYSHKSSTGDEPAQLDLPPDGGYGWVCCVCSGLVFFTTWGSNSAFGVYLSYYINNDVFPGATRMDFAWIAGIFTCCVSIFSPVALTMDKLIGMKPTMSIAIVMNFIGYMLASFATKLWQLYICQGVVVGSAYSLIFVPATTVVPNWFLKKRSLASGIMCTGTGLGGLFYSLTVNAMIQKTGDQRWSLRFVAITTTIIMIIAVTFIKRRNPPPKPKLSFANFFKILGSMFNPHVLVKGKLWYMSFWFCLTMLGYSITLFSYASAATALGLSQHQASVLTAILNTAQALGRPSMGFIADWWVGRINYTMILNGTVMVFVFAFWMQARSFAALLLCGICLGATLGVGNVMNPVLAADAFLPEEFACAWAIMNIWQGVFVMFSEVIALSLEDTALTNPFQHAQIFAGFMFFAGLLCLIPLREYFVKKELKKRSLTLEKLSFSGGKADSTDKESDIKNDAKFVDLLKKTSYWKRALYPIKV